MPPFIMDFNSLIRRLGIEAEKFDDGRSQKVMVYDQTSGIQLTTKAFFNYFRVYNVPVHMLPTA